MAETDNVEERVDKLEEEIRELKTIVEYALGHEKCFCQHAIGHPLVKKHTNACEKARELIYGDNP